MPPSKTTPDVARPDVSPGTRQISEILPPYQVVLHNDPYNTMDHVIRAITKAVPGINLLKATAIMLEAHTKGRGRVIVCPKELAELYQERLQTFGLTVSIERA